MKGMESLLKMFGISPELIQAEVKKAAAQFNAEHKHFDDKLNVIIENQNRIAAGMNIQLVTQKMGSDVSITKQ